MKDDPGRHYTGISIIGSTRLAKKAVWNARIGIALLLVGLESIIHK